LPQRDPGRDRGAALGAIGVARHPMPERVARTNVSPALVADLAEDGAVRYQRGGVNDTSLFSFSGQ